MIKDSLTFTDGTGKHICQKVGKKVIVDSQSTKTLEEDLISGVQSITHDASISHDVKLIKNPNSDSYVLKTDTCFYFVRRRNSHVEIILDEDNMGFYIGHINYELKTHSEGDRVMFWVINKETGNRVNHYRYFKW